MVSGYDVKTVYSFFFKSGFRSKRTKVFFVFSFIPALVFLIFKLVEILNPESRISTPDLFLQIGVSFYFQLFIPILSLFYGSSVLNDEIDNQTLIYLTTSPVSKASILAGKFLASFAISLIIITSGLFISFFIAHFSHLLEARYMNELISFVSIALLSILAYSSLFTLMGSFLKKSVLLGIFFIFGWESVVQFFPGTTQKLTISHFIKSLLPSNIPEKAGFLVFRLEPSSTAESISVLMIVSILFLIVSIVVFYKKEYILSDTK